MQGRCTGTAGLRTGAIGVLDQLSFQFAYVAGGAARRHTRRHES
jgi:hypothetical protein